MRYRLVTVAVAATLLVSAPATAAVGDDASESGSDGGPVVSVGSLRDLKPGTDNPTDGASAALVATETATSTHHRLVLWGLDSADSGRSFGVHVHVGPCVPGEGEAAGDHYNTGGDPSPDTEVWLDTTARPGGIAMSTASTPFVIPDGDANSVVVHENPTDDTGDAGDRIACLPAPY